VEVIWVDMFQRVASLESVTRSLVAALALLVVVMLITGGLGISGPAILTFTIWVSLLGLVAVGAFLIARAERPVAGAGALVAALAVGMAYFWRSNPGPLLWPVAFLLAAGLIAYGTRRDVSLPTAWLLLLPRFVVGWAFLDNGQNDYTWAFTGGNFLTSANAAIQRGPLWFLDGPYNAFLSGVVVGRPDTWAGLFVSGELIFGLLLALGLFTPSAAWGTMWLSANIIMEKSFISHGAYVDKTYFVIELFCLLSRSGLAYGLDAALVPYLPAALSSTLGGALPDELPSGRVRSRQPARYSPA
jgi:uncharacterized membrane protein YphA (DoxX/SURF4 family)